MIVELLGEAIERIEGLLSDAETRGLREPTAMSLATVDESGRPAVRTVLLKHVGTDGLIFFTNTSSRKGRQLERLPYAAISIYFQDAHQQVQVDGEVVMVSDDEADHYWQTRPRASQIGAWASRQSEILESRQLLYDRVASYEARFEGQSIPRPDFWSGYRVIPERVEFWTGHPDRLNQREQYLLVDGRWSKGQLYP